MGLTEMGVPLVTEMLPGVTTPVPPLKTAVKVVLLPASMVGVPETTVALDVKLVIRGAEVTVTVVVCVMAAAGSPGGVTVSV